MLGRYVSDLEVGEVMGPIEYVITPFLVREYAHGVEDGAEVFHRAGTADAPQLAPATLAHLAKVRMFLHACPEGPGPVPRIHVEYDATYHRPIEAGTRVRVSGVVRDRYLRGGREWLVSEFAIHDAGSDELYARYRDTSIIGYEPSAKS